MQTNMGTLAVDDARVYCGYSYSACHSDELSFSFNDTLTITNRERTDERAWWTAENADGAVGLVPRNYLAVSKRICRGAHHSNAEEVTIPDMTEMTSSEESSSSLEPSPMVERSRMQETQLNTSIPIASA